MQSRGEHGKKSTEGRSEREGMIRVLPRDVWRQCLHRSRDVPHTLPIWTFSCRRKRATIALDLSSSMPSGSMISSITALSPAGYSFEVRLIETLRDGDLDALGEEDDAWSTRSRKVFRSAYCPYQCIPG